MESEDNVIIQLNKTEHAMDTSIEYYSLNFFQDGLTCLV